MTAEIWPSLLTAAAVGLATGYIGSLMVVRRMALVGDALSHVALPGLAVGLLLGFNPFAGAFAFVLSAALITWVIERTSRLAVDAVVGVLFVLALAVGFLITPSPDLLEALFGDVGRVQPVAAVASVAIAGAAVVLTRLIYRPMILSVISEDLAVSAGVRVGAVSLVYLALVSVVVAVGVQVVGTLLVGALVIVPAAAAKLWRTPLGPFAVLSGLLGLATAVSGTALSVVVGVPAGPLVVVLGVAVFVASWVYSMERGRRESGPRWPSEGEESSSGGLAAGPPGAVARTGSTVR